MHTDRESSRQAHTLCTAIQSGQLIVWERSREPPTEPCFGIGHNLSRQLTSEDIKHHFTTAAHQSKTYSPFQFFSLTVTVRLQSVFVFVFPSKSLRRRMLQSVLFLCVHFSVAVRGECPRGACCSLFLFCVWFFFLAIVNLVFLLLLLLTPPSA